MGKKKYVNLTIDSENSQIGVIEIGVFDVDNPNNLIEIEKPLIQALTEHFDCEVKIKRSGVIIKQFPLKIEYYVVVCTDGEDYNEMVTLDETWLYKK